MPAVTLADFLVTDDASLGSLDSLLLMPGLYPNSQLHCTPLKVMTSLGFRLNGFQLEPVSHFLGCPFCMLPIVVQLLSWVQFFVTPWTAAHQASLAFTISQSLFKLMSIESVMSSNHLILCHPLLLLPLMFPSFRVFSIESALHHVAKVLELQLWYQSF